MAKAASHEVLETHKGLNDSQVHAYLDTYFQRTWDHFDVNGSGMIEVIKMPQFMRMLCSDQRMSLEPGKTEIGINTEPPEQVKISELNDWFYTKLNRKLFESHYLKHQMLITDEMNS